MTCENISQQQAEELVRKRRTAMQIPVCIRRTIVKHPERSIFLLGLREASVSFVVARRGG